MLDRLRSALARGGVALRASVVALGLALVQRQAGEPTPAPLFLIAVAVATWFAGPASGALAALAQTLLIVLLFPGSTGVLTFLGPAELVRPGVFVVAAALMIGLVTMARSASRRAETANARLQAVADAMDEGIIVYDTACRVVFANRVARDATDLWHQGAAAPPTASMLRARLRPTTPDGEPVARLPGERALAGERVEQELLVTDQAGRTLRTHVRATPLRDSAGRVTSAVVVWRDITALHDTIASRSRFDGAVKTVRLVAHELGNSLYAVTGYGELLPRLVEGEAAEMAREMADGVADAAHLIARLQQIVRFEEMTLAGVDVLDLDAATAGGRDDGEQSGC